MKHALIFAAGRGERMRPLTDHTPKPLLCVGGKPLIVWHLEKLAAAGYTDVVINTSYLAEQFPATLGNGSRWGVDLHYLYEGDTPLETGGGMLNALALLGREPFLTLNGDIWCNVDLNLLPADLPGVAHLLLVDNPSHHPDGDFALDTHGVLHTTGALKLTYSGIGIYRHTVLQDWASVITTAAATPVQPPRFKLAPLLRAAVARGAVTGVHYTGAWLDVGTPTRWQALNTKLLHTNADYTPD